MVGCDSGGTVVGCASGGTGVGCDSGGTGVGCKEICILSTKTQKRAVGKQRLKTPALVGYSYANNYLNDIVNNIVCDFHRSQTSYFQASIC